MQQEGRKKTMHDEKKHHNRFSEGFFWGAVIGGATAYVLSHKKGREFIKELFQDGIDFLEEKAEKAIEKEVFIEQDPAMEDEEIVEVHTKDYEKIEEDVPKSMPKKRFFKKASKPK